MILPQFSQRKWQDGEYGQKDGPRRKAGETCCWPRKEEASAEEAPTLRSETFRDSRSVPPLPAFAVLAQGSNCVLCREGALLMEITQKQLCAFTLIAAHAKFAAVEQDHFMVAVEPGMDFFDF